MDLIENDLQILKIFEEAYRIMLPFQLCKFFTSFLLTENIQGNIIWENFKTYFSEDFHENKDNLALNHINNLLLLEDVSCKDFGLPEPEPIINDIKYDNNITSISKEMFENMFTKLNEDQKFIFNELVNNMNKINFIDGPGGSGKTFLYKTLIYYFLSKGKNIISMAWTGIASILLPKGMTTHRTFRLPLDLSSIENSFLKLESDKKKLRETKVIIWNEASMIPKKDLEIIDRTLRDLFINDIPFGGKLIILGGDFRQILPVMKNGVRSAIIEDTIKYSELWPLFKIFKLKRNIRSQNNEFSKLLLQIGDGNINPFIIPNNWKTNDVCYQIYQNINQINEYDRVILAPHNEDIKVLNEKIKLLNGDKRSYYSIDYATHKNVDQSDDNIRLLFPIETLNTIYEGLPPHKLDLKVNAIVMLIRNLSVHKVCVTVLDLK